MTDSSVAGGARNDSLSGVLNDVVGFRSLGCLGQKAYTGAGSAKIPWASWNATIGWDPVTGLGTPNFRRMMHLALES